MSETLALTQNLISRASITPADAGCLDHIAHILSQHGFSCERFDTEGVSSLWAQYGNASPTVCLLGHTDVVPPGAAKSWATPPFEPTIINDKLYGRGAADMKASVAAFTLAATRFVTDRPHFTGTLAILLTSDEEGPAQFGTQYALSQLAAKGKKIDYCLVGEPSCSDQLGDTIKIGRRGSLTGKLTVQGKQGHVAYPQLAMNPIHIALHKLDELAQTQWDDGNQFFPPTSLQLVNIHSDGGASNVIPDTLTAQFNFRFNPLSPANVLQDRVNALFSTLPHQLDWHLSGSPFYTEPNSPFLSALTQSVESHTQLKPTLSTGGGTSDGRFVAPTGADVIEFGPVNQTIHKIDEHVLVADIDRLTDIYQDALRLFFAPSQQP